MQAEQQKKRGPLGSPFLHNTTSHPLTNWYNTEEQQRFKAIPSHFTNVSRVKEYTFPASIHTFPATPDPNNWIFYHVISQFSCQGR